MTKMFRFDPLAYADVYAEKGFVHIREGLTKEFHQLLDRQVEQHLEKQRLEKFAIGDKQQALYEFPEGGNFHQELVDTVGRVCGLKPGDLVLSERHVKAYDASAAPNPLAHKDRFASEVSVGFSIRVPEGSTLVLYPYDELEVNPFNSSAELRSSLRPDTVPENTLRHGRRVEIADVPRDVNIFRGNAIWHLRARPANTVIALSEA